MFHAPLPFFFFSCSLFPFLCFLFFWWFLFGFGSFLLLLEFFSFFHCFPADLHFTVFTIFFTSVFIIFFTGVCFSFGLNFRRLFATFGFVICQSLFCCMFHQ